MTDEKKKWIVKPYGSMHAIYHESKPNSPLIHSMGVQSLMRTANELNNLPTRPESEVNPTRGDDEAMNEWESEPDRKHWIDETTGLDCLIVRQPRLKHLCGYVGVPNGHKYYGVDYFDVDVEVHGGLTYSSKCDGHICHHEDQEIVANKDVWWLGFDCAHAGDLSPGLGIEGIGICGDYEIYRTIEYVEAECKNLATRLAKEAKP